MTENKTRTYQPMLDSIGDALPRLQSRERAVTPNWAKFPSAKTHSLRFGLPGRGVFSGGCARDLRDAPIPEAYRQV